MVYCIPAKNDTDSRLFVHIRLMYFNRPIHIATDAKRINSEELWNDIGFFGIS